MFLFWNSSFAQNDSLKLFDNDSTALFELPVFSIRALELPKIANWQNQSIDFVTGLQASFPILIKSYGSWGSVSTLSIHGTADDQSSVLWHGIPIHSTTLGSTDLSIIPLEAMENVELITANDATNRNSSSFGGVLELNSSGRVFNPKIDSNIGIKINLGIGSNGLYSQSFKGFFQNKKIKFQSSIFNQQANNDFLYKDVYKENSPKERASNNQMKNFGFVEDIYFFTKKGIISASAWWQKKDKAIPSIMGSNGISNKNQSDKVLRISNNYDLYFKKSILNLTIGYLQDKLNYTDKINATDNEFYIDSKIDVKQFFQSMFLKQSFLNEKLIITFSDIFSFQKANVSSYTSQPSEWMSAISINADYRFKFIKINGSIKQEFRVKTSRPFFAFDIQFDETNRSTLFYKFSFAEKFRQPDLNDKYWNPGGNIDLLPEKGQTIQLEIGRILKFSKSSFRFILNPYLISIQQNIVWIPKEGIFSPSNISKTRHSGIDVIVEFKSNSNAIIGWDLTGTYNFNHSIIVDYISDKSVNGHFLPYKPRHGFKVNLNGNWKWLDLTVSNQLFGNRYIDNSNNEIFKLPNYFLLDFSIGGKWSKNGNAIGGHFSILNATNTAFQSIRSYAQPGTQFLFTINYYLQKSLKQKNEKN